MEGRGSSMMETVRIQVLFTEDTPKGPYTDALYFTQAEYAATPRKTIDDAKAARVTAWKAIIDAPPIELTKADIQKQIDNVDQMKADLLTQWASAK